MYQKYICHKCVLPRIYGMGVKNTVSDFIVAAFMADKGIYK